MEAKRNSLPLPTSMEELRDIRTDQNMLLMAIIKPFLVEVSSVLRR